MAAKELDVALFGTNSPSEIYVMRFAVIPNQVLTLWALDSASCMNHRKRLCHINNCHI